MNQDYFFDILHSELDRDFKKRRLTRKYAWECEGNKDEKCYKLMDYIHGCRYKVIDLETGKKYDFPMYTSKAKLIIPPELDNQDFFYWLCITSSDGCYLVPKKYITETLIDFCIDNLKSSAFIDSFSEEITREQYIRIINKAPELVRYVPGKFIDEKIVRFVISIDPENIFGVPKGKVSDELRRKCYEKLNIKGKKRLIRDGYMSESFMTTERLTTLVKSNQVLNKKRIDYEFWKNISPEIITEEISKLMFECNSEYVRFIPENHLTNEMVKKALEEEPRLISKIPKKFMTKENVEMALKKAPRQILWLPEDIMDKYFTFVVGLRGTLLAAVPEEKKTTEICQIAFTNDNNAFKYIPHKCKTREMCIMALRRNPKLIRYVPVAILENDFLDTLKELGIVIEKKDEKYVKEAIHVSRLITTPYEEEKDSEKPLNIPPEIAHIYIQDLLEYFSRFAQEALKDLRIYTLGSLFQATTKKEFVEHLADKTVFSEILNTNKILRCKYLNEDPLIDLSNDELDLFELCKSLGFSNRVIACLLKSTFGEDPKKFIEKVSSPNATEELKGIRGLGKGGIMEVISKTRVVLDYYNNKEKQESSNNQLAEIKALNEELQRLIAQRDQYDALIQEVCRKIQEKTAQNSVGGNTK